MGGLAELSGRAGSPAMLPVGARRAAAAAAASLADVAAVPPRRPARLRRAAAAREERAWLACSRWLPCLMKKEGPATGGAEGAGGVKS